jgi:hypothetical protein
VDVLLEQVLVTLPVLPGHDVAVAHHRDAPRRRVLGLRGLQHVVPVRELVVALQTTASVKLCTIDIKHTTSQPTASHVRSGGAGTYKDGGEAVVEAALQLGDQLVRRGGFLVPAGAYLDRDAARGQLRRHGVQDLEQAVGFVHHRRATAAVAHEIDRTGRVQILDAKQRCSLAVSISSKSHKVGKSELTTKSDLTSFSKIW